jgi:hypothetical protein
VPALLNSTQTLPLKLTFGGCGVVFFFSFAMFFSSNEKRTRSASLFRYTFL